MLKCFEVEVSTKRYLLITVKTYPSSSESYTSIQLFKLDEETKEYTPQKYLTLKFRIKQNSLGRRLHQRCQCLRLFTRRSHAAPQERYGLL